MRPLQIRNAALLLQRTSDWTPALADYLQTAAQLVAGGLADTLGVRMIVAPDDVLLKMALACIDGHPTPQELWCKGAEDGEQVMGADGVVKMASTVFVGHREGEFVRAANVIALYKQSGVAEHGKVCLSK